MISFYLVLLKSVLFLTVLRLKDKWFSFVQLFLSFAMFFLFSAPWVLSKSRSQEPVLIFTWRAVSIFFSLCRVTQCKTTEKVHLWFHAMKQQKSIFFPTTLQSVLFPLLLGSGCEPISEGRPTPGSPVSEARNVWHGHGHWREDVWRLRGPQRYVSFFSVSLCKDLFCRQLPVCFFRGPIFGCSRAESELYPSFIVFIAPW